MKGEANMELLTKDFTASIGFDYKLYREEIEYSIAHASLLVEHGYLTEEERVTIVDALREIEKEIEDGTLSFSNECFDIHGNIRAFLISKTGNLGKKLGIARGINDQVVTDSRLFLKKEIRIMNGTLTDLLDTLEKLAREHVNTIMPGYSHVQRAQPVTLAYHLLAYYQMFKRDRKRFDNCLEGMDFLPPDSGALAGNIYGTDRTSLVKDLGFSGMLPNAMDAVSDRDFAMEFINCCAITMMHLSRFCEDLILWSTVEFSFIEIADDFTTGSRLMPQKKNMDVAELIRGKSGRVYGDLISLLTIFKGLPMSYNRDMQEDKVAVLDAAETTVSCLSIFVEMIKTMKINRGAMQRAAKYGYMNAPEIREYLMEKGASRDEAMNIIGKLVIYAINNEKAIEDLWLDDLRKFSQMFDNDIYDRIAIRNVIEAKKSTGSTSFDSVEEQLEQIARER
jgi:argininosuccinate lyase